MKRRLNFKIIVALVVLILAIGGGVYAVHKIQVNRRVDKTLAAAERAERQGELESAERNLKLYLAYRPDDLDNLVRYALLVDKRAETPEQMLAAVMVLEQAHRRIPGNRDVQRKAADRFMELGRYDEARPHLEELLGRDEPKSDDEGGETNPEEGELEQLLALCAVAAEEYEVAEAWYEAAIRHDPQRIESYYQLAELRRTRLDNAEAADQVMDLPQVDDGVIAANGEAAEAFLARALYRRQFGLEGADADLARALELEPDNADALAAAASEALRSENIDVARGHLERGLQQHPDDVRMYDTLAQVETQAGQKDQAAESLRRGIEIAESAEQRIPLLWRLADLRIDNAEYDKIPAIKSQLEESQALPEVLTFLDARVLMAKGEWSAAARTLESALPRLPSRSGLNLVHQAHLLLGQCYERLGQTDRQLAAFRRAVELEPGSTAGQVGLGATLAATGRIDEALAAYRRVVDQVPAAKVEVARLQFARTLRLPEAQRDQRAWNAVNQALDEASAAVPDSVDIPILRSQALATQGQLDAAQSLLAKARDAQPGQVRFWTALAGLTGARNGLEAARAVLDEAEQRLGDNVDLRLARAVTQVNRDSNEVTTALEALSGNADGFSPEDRRRLLQGLAAVYRGVGDTAASTRLLDQVAKERPDDLNAQITLFDLAVQKGDEAAMNRLIGEIRRVEGEDGSFWRYCTARYQIWLARQAAGGPDKDALADARRFLVETAERRPDWSLLALARGEVEDLEGNADTAVAHYLKAIELGENRPEVLARATQILAARGRFGEANEVIRKAQDADGNLQSPELRRLAAEVALRTGDAKRALALARTLNLAESDNYRDHLWFGQVLSAAEAAEAAEVEFRKAVALAGDVPEVWIALVQFLARSDQPAAEAAVEQARAQLTGDGADLTLGRLETVIGRTDQARERFQAALAVKPDDIEALRSLANLDLVAGQFADAQVHLRKLVGLESQDPNAAASARRLLAFLIAASGNRQQSREALVMLGLSDDVSEYRPRAEDPVDDLRALAGVLATRQDRASRRAAIRVLEHIEGRGTLTPGDQFLLAQLEWAEQDWPSYRDRIQTLIAADAENPSYLGHYIDVLLRRKDTNEAALWLRRLGQIAPEALATIALRARLLDAQGQKADGVKLLESAIAGKDELIGPVAQLLESMGQKEAAERLFRRLVQQAPQPEAALVLAGFLGRQGNMGEALDLCERAWKDCKPEVVSSATVQILFTGSATEEHLQRSASRIEQATRENPRLVSLRFDLANVLSIWGRADEALAIYGDIYKNDPSKSGPLNNMAFLLALQGTKGDEALSLINKAIEIEGETTDLLDTRAMVYLMLGRNEDAIADLDDAIALGPTADKYFHLARAHLAVDDRVEAAEAFQEAISLGLEEGDLHPLEREAFRQVNRELTSR